MKDDRLARGVLLFILLLIVGGVVIGVRMLVVEVWPEVQEQASEPSLLPKPEMTPTVYPHPMTVVESMQTLSRLETASFVIEKVITAESGQGPLEFLFGDRLLLIAYGEVIAGVDLEKVGPNDVWRDADGTIYIHLPEPEVLVTRLDNERTEVYDRDTGLVGLNIELETEARREAERQILEAALGEGLLDRAATNAREFVRSLLHSMGVERVIFVDDPATPTPAPALTPTLQP
jgi:hypothetical protein